MVTWVWFLGSVLGGWGFVEVTAFPVEADPAGTVGEQPVTGEVEASWLISTAGEKNQAELALTEAALVKYPGDVDNVVFINTVKVTEGKNTVFAQGAAFKCD